MARLTTTALCLLGLLALASAEVYFEERFGGELDLRHAGARALAGVRGGVAKFPEGGRRPREAPHARAAPDPAP
jgi:hypothetical protein